MIEPHAATTFLFVPGDRPDRFERAATSGAEVVILDLEDGVDPERRPEARQNAADWLKSGKSAVVRLNARHTADHLLDVSALRGLVSHVMLSRTESACDAEATAADIGSDVAVVALIETSRGVIEAASIAASPAVVRLAFGHIDFSTELGVDSSDRQSLLTARSHLVHASAAAGLHGPVDGVTTRLNDAPTVTDDAAHAASLGFRGKLCVHPNQLAAAKSEFAPSVAQIAWAREVLATRSSGEARVVGGAMIDRPVEERAREILRRAL